MSPDSSPPCSICGGETSVRPVPPDCRSVLAGAPTTIRLCQECLATDPDPGTQVDRGWAPEDVTPALPSDPDAAVAVAILVDLLDSLALNRREIVTVVEYLERGGVDPLLAIDRVADDPSLSPHVDLDRRRDQLAQVLGQ